MQRELAHLDVMNTALMLNDPAIITTPTIPSLTRYEPISLDTILGVALMDRTDTKYVLSTSTMHHVLELLANDYYVLEIGGRRQHLYKTLYFDSPKFTNYYRHHAGGLNRYKVRIREYVDSEDAFLEVKHKTNKKRTIKNRVPVDTISADSTENFSDDSADFLSHAYPHSTEDLVPVLWNNFTRVTLVSKQRKERLTLDFDISFTNGEDTQSVPHIAIAEVKQEGFLHDSDFMHQMRLHHIRQSSFSKYCVGVSLLYPDIKHNNFKPILRHVDQLK